MRFVSLAPRTLGESARYHRREQHHEEGDQVRRIEDGKAEARRQKKKSNDSTEPTAVNIDGYKLKRVETSHHAEQVDHDEVGHLEGGKHQLADRGARPYGNDCPRVLDRPESDIPTEC